MSEWRRSGSEDAREVKAYVIAHMEKALESYFGLKNRNDEAWVLVKNPNLFIGGNTWAPDFASYQQVRASPAQGENVPDWVCEIFLPSDEDDVRSRVGDYLRSGVQNVWICDIQGRRIEIYTRIPDDPCRASLVCVDEGDPRGSDFLRPREGIHFDTRGLWPERQQKTRP
jgi:hypothetical protein